MDKIQELKDGKQPVPLQIQIVPANVCNQACHFCFVPGTEILTDNGYKRIETVEQYDNVYDGDGNIQYVKDVYSRKYNGPILSFDFSRYHVPFNVTPEHPVWVNSKKDYIPSKDIKIGDSIRVPILSISDIKEIIISNILDGVIIDGNNVKYTKSKYSIPNTITLNKEFGELCGFYLAEGHSSIMKNRPNSGNVVFTFNKHEKTYIARVVSLIKDLFNLDAKLSTVGPTTQVIIGSKILVDVFVSLFGSGSRIKNINTSLWSTDYEFFEGIMLGYLSGDGCFKDNSFSTTSLGLALSILNMCYKHNLSPNIYSSITRESFIDGRKIKSGGNTYTIRFRGNDRTTYDRIVDNYQSKKIVKNWKPLEIIDNKYVLFKIENITEQEYDGYVYNFSVNNTETYIANGISVHNCAYRMKDYLSNQNFDDKQILSADKIKETLDCAADMGVKAIQYTGGGEPLVHPNMHELFNYTIAKGLDLSLVSNGMALTEDMCKTLGDAAWVRISVDAGNAQTYSLIRKVPKSRYDKVIDNIKNLVKHKKNNIIGVGFVVNKENYTEVLEAAKTFKEIGVDNFRISAAFTPIGYEYFDSFMEEAKALANEAALLSDDKFTVFNLFNDRVKDTFEGTQDYNFCPIKELQVYLGADYKLYTCCTLAYNDKGEIGSIKDQSFKELWESEQKTKMFANHNPKCHCKFPCMYKGKNDFINYCIKTDAKHINYI